MRTQAGARYVEDMDPGTHRDNNDKESNLRLCISAKSSP
jgi:hypothetical protein